MSEPLLTARRLVVIAERTLIDHEHGTARFARLTVQPRPRVQGEARGVARTRLILWLGDTPFPRRRPRRWTPSAEWTAVAHLDTLTIRGELVSAHWSGLRDMLHWTTGGLAARAVLHEIEALDRTVSDEATLLYLEEIAVHPRVRGQALAHWLMCQAVEWDGLWHGDMIALQACAIRNAYASAGEDPDEELPIDAWRPQQDAVLREYHRWGFSSQIFPAGPERPLSHPSRNDIVAFWYIVDDPDELPARLTNTAGAEQSPMVRDRDTAACRVA